MERPVEGNQKVAGIEKDVVAEGKRKFCVHLDDRRCFVIYAKLPRFIAKSLCYRLNRSRVLPSRWGRRQWRRSHCSCEGRGEGVRR